MTNTALYVLAAAALLVEARWLGTAWPIPLRGAADFYALGSALCYFGAPYAFFLAAIAHRRSETGGTQPSWRPLAAVTAANLLSAALSQLAGINVALRFGAAAAATGLAARYLGVGSKRLEFALAVALVSLTVAYFFI
jgi:hypothetical protein